jgi:DNA-binding response OmpR family regulator
VHKLLIADDEKDLVNGLEMSFKNEGYQVLKAYDGETALKIAFEENPHLIILDVMMPGKNGLDLCQAIRRRELNTRIIMLSAKGEEIDRVVGLEVGADDYVSKPFCLRELQALVRARLRYRAAAGCEFVSKYRFDGVELDFDKLQASKMGVRIDLTPREFDLLRFLVQQRGQIVTRDRILDKIWGHDLYLTARTVDNYILRLRKKLEPDPANPQYILSVYGGGYKFVG